MNTEENCGHKWLASGTEDGDDDGDDVEECDYDDD